MTHPKAARAGELFLSWVRARIDAYRLVHPRFVSSLVMMGAAGAAALVAVAYAKAIEWATETMGRMSEQHPFVFVALSPLWFVAAWALVRYVAPGAGGSGIPQVMADVHRAATDGREGAGVTRNVRLVLVKISSSIAAILGGGAVGREGPTIQISAAVFEAFDGAFKRYVSRRRSREALLIAGGGAGLAAAFNTPLGGVIFAIEELASQHFKTFKGVLILSVVTAGYVTQAILGPYLFIGHPAIGAVTWRDAASGLVASLFVGLAGALFGKGLYAASLAARKLDARRRALLAAGVGIVMSGVCVALGPDASGGGSLLIRKLLFGTATEVARVGWPLAVWRVVGLVVTYVSGCAGGIFAPSLAAGAAIGAMLATGLSFENHSLIIVMSMIAFLAGATRSPFTSFILVFEMTDRQAAVVPMMAAALLANLAARAIDHESFYEKMREVFLAADAPVPAPTPPVNDPPRALAGS